METPVGDVTFLVISFKPLLFAQTGIIKLFRLNINRYTVKEVELLMMLEMIWNVFFNEKQLTWAIMILFYLRRYWCCYVILRSIFSINYRYCYSHDVFENCVTVSFVISRRAFILGGGSLQPQKTPPWYYCSSVSLQKL